MEYISAEEFLKQDKKVQEVFINWWKGNKSVTDIVTIKINKERWRTHLLLDVDLAVFEIGEDLIPLFTEGQIRKFIEDKTKYRVQVLPYKGINLNLRNKINLMSIDGINHGCFSGLDKNLVKAYWEVSVQIAKGEGEKAYVYTKSEEKDRIQELERKIAEATEIIEKQQVVIESKEEEAKSLRLKCGKLGGYKMEYEDVCNENEELKKQIDSKDAEIKQHEENEIDLYESLELKDKEISMREQKLDSQGRYIEQLKEQLKEAQDIKIGAEESKDIISKQMDEIEELKSRLNDRENDDYNENQELKKENMKWRSAYANMTQQIRELKQAIKITSQYII